ncbi:MAG: hypothetical protein NZ520_01480 [bacterium]|nr:hypothetical protein [bacterium]MCS7309155.1 hypothetical protein [Armatimonadota bacterium]
MTLREFTNAARKQILEALQHKQPPPIGHFDRKAFEEAMQMREVQMGSAHYTPRSVVLEFVFWHDTPGAPLILSVEVETPEPVVFLPVPDWVQQDVWQGEVKGTFRLRSEAEQMLETFRRHVLEGENLHYFEERPAPRRE